MKINYAQRLHCKPTERNKASRQSVIAFLTFAFVSLNFSKTNWIVCKKKKQKNRKSNKKRWTASKNKLNFLLQRMDTISTSETTRANSTKCFIALIQKIKFQWKWWRKSKMKWKPGKNKFQIVPVNLRLKALSIEWQAPQPQH